MTDETFEKLAIRWPELFEKAEVDHFEICDGWYNIIDTLCFLISKDIDNFKYRLKSEIESPNSKNVNRIADLESQIKKSIEELPIITKVKVKNGTLRFYAENVSEKVNNYIEFAELMSSRTCEICGDPAILRCGGWWRVLCSKHNVDQETE